MPKLDSHLSCSSLTQRGAKCKLKRSHSSRFCRRHSKEESLTVVLNRLERQRSKGKYSVLTGATKEKVRVHYRNVTEVPLNKITPVFKDLEENKVAVGYSRLVVGDHGAYFEFEEKHLCDVNELKVKPGQEFRCSSSNNPYVKYVWLETKGGTKVYLQTKTVRYADYVPGRYYVSPNKVVVF